MVHWLTFSVVVFFLSLLTGCSFEPPVSGSDACERDSDCRTGRFCVAGHCSNTAATTDSGTDVADCSEDQDEDGFFVGPGCAPALLDCNDNDEFIYPAAPQRCNGLDNDCDGFVDMAGCECPEGASRPCGVDIGACEEGTQVCSSGVWGACTGMTAPEAETCDGDDNDCDGTVDEGCACQGDQVRDCGMDRGECVAGTQSCEDGVWKACEGAVRPSPEVCDGKDNDCDGTPDDNPNDVGDSCNTGALGACESGNLVCMSGQISCEGPHPVPEFCNGVDDDCNGLEDDSLDPTCMTACGLGTQTCDLGMLSRCIPTNPPPEVCDGVDNNCDGAIDESFPEAGQACSTGLAGDCSQGEMACTGGALKCVPLLANQPEICDGSDNDCDGIIDEDSSGMALARQCGAVCPDRSVQLCSAGSWGACDRADLEVCNGEDSNCDGTVDEAAKCYQVCNGALVEGVLSCATGGSCALTAAFCTANPTCCP